jgi:hypothetical protein
MWIDAFVRFSNSLPRTRDRLLIVTLACTALSGCHRQPSLSGEAYREAVVSFYTGLAALQTSQEVLAREHLERVIALAPGEPAAWADVGLLLLRQQDLDGALQRLTKAAQLAPDNADVQRLLGLTESRRGNLQESIRHWKRALRSSPDDAKAGYALAVDLDRQGTAESVAEAQATLASFADRTGNLVVRLEYARVAAKRGDRAALQRAVQGLTEVATAWPPDIRNRFETVQQSAASNPQAAAQNLAFLRNVLMRLGEYRQAYAAVNTPQAEVGEPIDRLLVLANPSPQPAPLDASLTFAIAPEKRLSAGANAWIAAIERGPDPHPAIAMSDGRSVHFSSGSVAVTLGNSASASSGLAAARNAGVVADFNYDFMPDLAVSGGRGLELLRQQTDGTFANVTEASRLPASVLSTPAAGLWAADIDTDGDLDIVEALTDGPVRVLRNNGDDTFAVQQPFTGSSRVRDFVWADLDGDGVPDATLLDAAGATRVFVNARGGSFRERAVPPTFPRAVALAAAEVTGDSIFDLLALTSSGAVMLLSPPNGRDAAWTTREFARTAEALSGLTAGAAGLLTADLDNNGATDIVISGSSDSRVLLRGPDGSTRPLDRALPMEVREAVDVDGDGRLELVGIQPDGQPAIARSSGDRRYHWQAIRTRAATATGDQRINSFGVGGEIELRTGLHLQKQLIAGPVSHVGLGEAGGSEVVRITWPNGVLQSEFNVGADASIAASQRLKGSCPWLFAWNGREMAFATDVLWRSPLGLRINAQATAEVAMTEDWVRLRGDQLQPRNGFYDLRITAELWETHFFDLASLLVVDHPADTEVFVDERFAVPPPRTGVIVTGPVQPLGSAKDDSGRGVDDVLRDRDDHYLDFAGRGRYQGVTREHFVEVEIPDAAPRSGSLWLIAQGWIHPTDSSINVAISQGSQVRPHGLALSIADAAGRFEVARADLGFPAGKNKTILIDLSGVFENSGPRRARLSTNMEIFWDRIGWAVGRPDASVSSQRIALESAELRYRGYSRTDHVNPGGPEVPRYAVEGTTPRWRDLEGYYTRFGDVRDLLLGVDDRYVIMNAGDELLLRFREAPARAGAVRDFVMITDGWEKDGDLNTTFSKTVLPLPTHSTRRYDRAPGRLEDDPIYLRHTQDFLNYHTRYVTADPVRDALRQPKDPRP